ncbi:hypothetical protein B0J15DRAFT_514765 [Fusarium solani]|uniref:RGS domain-containing protein n=1 Tax=Fusarium solani TaxID=169388 RepID=A0A9P9K4W6_FUSSL|nr:uncharacterized protein B0J15DRAFT_514765 [Fusarium solani]KAH7248113.1 hypothetical protein B0J15DRAFT_514765 [Fusarium solani]
MGLSRSRRQSPECLSPTLPPPSPQPSSAFEDFFDVDSAPSRPMSEAFMSGTSTPNGALGSRPPSLAEILLDVASPPWTLTAFMAYLSNNHCMESLEFTLDSQRYTAIYNEMITDNPNPTQENHDRVCALWEKLMQVYIIPCAPREVNIPARIRDELLNLPCGPAPPHPSQLAETGRILYELMNDSLLVPFLQSVAPMQLDGPSDEHARGSRRSSNSNSRMGAPVRSMNSMHHIESDSMTDDSDCNSPPGMEPMTPPTTPPISEWGFTTSPGDLGWNRNPDLRQDGGSRDGTAARPESARSCGKITLVQKNIRMRRRTPKTSEPMASLQPTSTPSCKGQEYKAPASYYHSGPLVASLSASSLAADSDQESMMFCSTPLSDVSNYLPSPVHSSEDMSCPPTTLDSESFRYASPIQDMYGWDAELDRRNFCPSRSSVGSSEGCDAIALSYRRANGSKASLLQRVFRVGSSSSMSKYETAI